MAVYWPSMMSAMISAVVFGGGLGLQISSDFLISWQSSQLPRQKFQKRVLEETYTFSWAFPLSFSNGVPSRLQGTTEGV